MRFVNAFATHPGKRSEALEKQKKTMPTHGKRTVPVRSLKGTPLKYYDSDVGMRNARLNFRQQKENHIMENILFNELRVREFDVDVGVVEVNTRSPEGKSKRVQYEVDFIANKGSRRYYIQSAFAIPDEEKREQETRSLVKIQDSFKKIVVVREDIEPWHDDNESLYIGIEQFLLNETAMDL